MLKIYNVSVRKLKDGSFSGSFSIPSGIKRSEIVQFEDAESCELFESGRVITLNEQASEKFMDILDDINRIHGKYNPKPKEPEGLL
jgi:hypothetical protein